MAIYMMREVYPITTAWIYWNEELGLISLSSDWTNRTTIADKNLWATSVYNDGDTLSQSNCWKYYQRGNNYWFAWTWSITQTTTRVNASSYWPDNYYSWSTFIYRTSSPFTWDSSSNNNLRWNTTDTNIARRWPCAEWFHVPTYLEWASVNAVWVNLWAWNYSSSTSWIKTYLKLPYAWLRSGSWEWTGSQWSYWNYWSSSPSSTDKSHYLRIYSSNNDGAESWKAQWFSIRPFKNEVTQPTEEWTVLYQ